jgi:hypothetical protein
LRLSSDCKCEAVSHKALWPLRVSQVWAVLTLAGMCVYMCVQEYASTLGGEGGTSTELVKQQRQKLQGWAVQLRSDA